MSELWSLDALLTPMLSIGLLLMEIDLETFLWIGTSFAIECSWRFVSIAEGPDLIGVAEEFFRDPESV